MPREKISIVPENADNEAEAGGPAVHHEVHASPDVKKLRESMSVMHMRYRGFEHKKNSIRAPFEKAA